MFGPLFPSRRKAKPNSTGFASSSRLRGEVKPPSLRCAPASGWQRVLFWMLAPAPLDAAPPLSQLPAVRADFRACLADATGGEAAELAIRIEHARSLRDLWHLRAALFNVLARHLTQAEATERVQSLNRHFSGRASRFPLPA